MSDQASTGLLRRMLSRVRSVCTTLSDLGAKADPEAQKGQRETDLRQAAGKDKGSGVIYQHISTTAQQHCCDMALGFLAQNTSQQET